MLVPVLEKSSLLTMLSGDNVDYLSVHESLCQCAWYMLNKYEQKQVYSEKLGIKSRAVMVLLIELRKVKEGSRATCDIISEALKRHAEMLQDHEHLLSEKGNTYELMKQTQRLRKGYTTVSLLRYHALKNKFLGPYTLLNAREKEVVSELAAKKELTLKVLEAMEEKANALMALHKADMLTGWRARLDEHREPSIASIIISLDVYQLLTDENLEQVLKHESPLMAVSALAKLNETGLFHPELCARVLKHRNLILFTAVLALSVLVNHELGTLDYFFVVLEQEDPLDAAWAIIKLHSHHLLTDGNQAKVLEHKNSFKAADALVELYKEGLFQPDLCAGVLKYETPFMAVTALLVLVSHKLGTLDKFLVILKQEHPIDAAWAIIELHSHHLLTDEDQEKVLKHKKPHAAARALTTLNSAGLFKPVLCDKVLKHEKPYKAAEACVELKEHKLDTPDNYFMILEHEYPDKAAMDLIASLTEPVSEDFVELMHTMDLNSRDRADGMDCEDQIIV